MTLAHLHDDLAAPVAAGRLTLARASAQVAAALKAIHEAIVIARTRRLQRELTFHGDFGDGPFGERDIRKIPQQPMIIGDRWDF